MSRKKKMIVDAESMKLVFFDNDTQKKIPDTVYHFCTNETMVNIISSSTLRLYNIEKSNDNNETKWIVEELEKALEKSYTLYKENNGSTTLEIENLKDKLHQVFDDNYARIYFGFSLSLDERSLSQWRYYGDDGKGVAIGFNGNVLSDIQTYWNSFVFAKVVYDLTPVRRLLIEKTRQLTQKGGGDNDYTQMIHKFLYSILKYAPLYKDKSFACENEWKLYYFPLNNLKNISYSNFSDWKKEIFNEKLDNGFEFVKLGTEVKDGLIRNYIELKFDQNISKLIKKIVIGKDSKIASDDKDLLWFLDEYGMIKTSYGKNNVEVVKL